jgi:phytoene/squalene synthetase
MKQLFDKVSAHCSKITTRAYSTSFSFGIYFLERKIHDAIYSIYGFVRLADEIVDSFHDFDKETLLSDFSRETFRAIETGISLNPILNSFQRTVNQYGIEDELIETFLKSMKMDLTQSFHDRNSYADYILGSAEVVGLMCLRVFCNGDDSTYDSLRDPAMRLGAAFQKVNFLRDLHLDYHDLKRSYFPDLDIRNFSQQRKAVIENEIREDFRAAMLGIQRLPGSARFGVYVAYVYYRALLKKIEHTSVEALLKQRLSVPNHQKFRLLVYSYLRYNLGIL